MSQNSRGIPGPGERVNRNGGGGSVRRARERMEAGLPPERAGRIEDTESMPIKGPRPVTPRSTDRSRVPNQPRRQAPMPAALSASRANPGTIGSAISKPAPMAQWPLTHDGSRGPSRSTADEAAASRGPAPERPPRPTHVPSLLDSSKIQEHTPSFPYKQQQPQQQSSPSRLQKPNRQPQVADWEDTNRHTNWPSPSQLISTPRSGTSDSPSTGSSVGSIPDFLVPAVPPSTPSLARRSQNLNLPPLSRRPHASSYYSQSSYVSPIPEEMPESMARNGGSMASSRVIPSSWGSGADFDVDQYRDQIDEEEDGRRSSGSTHDENTGLVRKASLGKRHKPALTTIKSSEDTPFSNNGDHRPRKIDTNKGGMVARAAVAAGAAGGAVAAGMGASRKEKPVMKQNVNGRTILLDNSSSSSSPISSEIDLEKPQIAMTKEPRSRSPLTSPVDSRVAQIRGGLEKGGMTAPTPAMSDRIPGTRRPPRLNIDAVKEAEARGSSTSLRDLIKRATKLASNLDRGKTASRIGMLDMLNSSKDGGKYSPNDRSRSGSISDILASFPPPGLATPTGDRPLSRWPSPFSPSALGQHHLSYRDSLSSGSTQAPKQPHRKCCGLPLWAFILLCFILLLLIAAAVVVPVILIVLPRQNQASQDQAAAEALSMCPSSAPCMNGGVSVVSGNACQCVCVNGFTGARCTVAGDNGCTTTDINADSSDFKNATLGNSIPRLLRFSESNFSIPLNSSALLSLFSTNNLSCTSENALVTFNGASQRRSLPLLEANLVDDTIGPVPTSAVAVHKILAARQAATSNGIVYAPTTAANGAVSTPTPTTSPASGGAHSGTGFIIDGPTLDFSRVAILFIFEQTRQLSSAVSAQEKIQGFFTNSQTYGNGSMGMTNFTIDFGSFTIGLPNGTTFGGRRPGATASS